MEVFYFVSKVSAEFETEFRFGEGNDGGLDRVKGVKRGAVVLGTGVLATNYVIMSVDVVGFGVVEGVKQEFDGVWLESIVIIKR